MPDTLRLTLPLLAAAQAQKHVTHNEALLSIDALVQLAVSSRDDAAPPASPVEGEMRHLGTAPTGAFAGQAGRIAERRDGLWLFHAPRAGWLMWVADEAVLLVFDGTAWRGVLDGARPENLSRLGVGTSADATNTVAARLNSALWTAREAAGGGNGDLRFVFNKEGAGDVLSLLFQAGYVGHAEIGLVGDDDLQVRVSPDGSSWSEAVRARSAGSVAFPSTGTTAAGANAVLDPGTGNTLLRSTSSARYKRDVEPLAASHADRVLDLRPVFYRSTAAHDRPDWSWYGLLAEEVAAVEPRLVHWAEEDGTSRPDAVQYDRVGVLLVDVVRRLRGRVEALEAAIDGPGGVGQPAVLAPKEPSWRAQPPA